MHPDPTTVLHAPKTVLIAHREPKIVLQDAPEIVSRQFGPSTVVQSLLMVLIGQ